MQENTETQETVTVLNSNDIAQEEPWREKFRQERQKAEGERLTHWREKSAKESSHLQIVEKKGENDEANIRVKVDLKYTSVKDEHEKRASTLSAAFGSASSEYINIMFQQTLNACFRKNATAANLAQSTIESLIAMNPGDIIEAQLCSRLYILTNQINEYFSRTTMPEQTTVAIDLNINRVTKLMRVYNETLETLNKHRRKGIQRVSVTHNHVNINDGGKAIVGSEINQQPGGGDHKKSKTTPRAKIKKSNICGAKSRRNNYAPCKGHPMKNGRCRMHGGCSTGPRTLEGKRRHAFVHLKHGRYTKEAILERKKMRLMMQWRHDLSETISKEI